MQIVTIQTPSTVAVIIQRDGHTLALARTREGIVARVPHLTPVAQPTVGDALRQLRRENMFAGVRP